MQLPNEFLEAATAGMNNAYTPYSNFHVGAALVTKAGKIYAGCNIENASYGLTNCAERTAIFKAISAGEREFAGLVVTGNTDGPIEPCGACRQVIAEFLADDTPIWLTNQKGAVQATNIGELLPGAFKPARVL